MNLKIDLDLATSRYQNQDGILASNMVPLGITVGRPRFPIRYSFLHDKKLLAPDYWMLKKPEPERLAHFDEWYCRKLEKHAIEIAAYLTEISEGHGDRGIVLLCFEDVHKGERCHRRMFADWFRGKTGREVPELPGPQNPQPSFI